MTWSTGITFKPPIKELRKQLKEVDAQLPKALSKALKKGAEVVSSDARSRLSGMDDAIARVSGQIKPGATAKGASINVVNSGRFPDAVARVMGMDRHSGWYARDRYSSSTGRQFAPWVGSSWKPGGPGGPRGVNAAIAAKADEMVKTLESEVDAVIARISK